MPWSPFSHVPRKTGREGTPESESGKSERKKKRPSYLQEFDILAEGLELDQSIPSTSFSYIKEKSVEPEKEKPRKMTFIQEKPEAKVKEKSSYKKLITNLQTTYPDLSHDDALKGILALRVQNNGTLTGMTMLEIMERVIKFVRPVQGKAKEEVTKESRKPVTEEEVPINKANTEETEKELPAESEDSKLSPGKTAKVDIERLHITKPAVASPKSLKTYSKRSKETMEEEDNSSNESPVPESENVVNETPKRKKNSKKTEEILTDETSEDADNEEVQEKVEILRTETIPRGRKKKESIDEQKAEDSDASYSPEETPKKSEKKMKEKLETPKTASKQRGRPKKNKSSENSIDEEKAEEDDESLNQEENPKKTEDDLETPRTTSKSRGSKKETPKTDELIDEDQAEESDESFNPEPVKKSPKAKSKKSHKKKVVEPMDVDQSEQNEEMKTPMKKKQATPKKKAEVSKISNDRSAIEETEEDHPRTSRKRKIPSYLREFEIPIEETKDMTEADTNEDIIVPKTPKPKSSKRRKVDADVETPKTTHKKKKECQPETPKSIRKKKIIQSLSLTEFGECVLCGLMFDEESTKIGMADKTRETGQTFADILFGLFHEESLPPSLAEKAKAVDLDCGSLCTLCVSHVDQLDVFQQKVTDIKTSIISIFIQKTRNDSLNQGEIESGDSDSEEEGNVIVKPTPKKRGRKPKGKGGKVVSLVYQSPLKKVRDLDAMSEKEISKMTETLIKFTLKKSKKVKATDNVEEINEIMDNDTQKEETAPTPDPELAQKLSSLNGIEIKRINTETGDESDATLQIAGLVGIEIRKISDEDQKTPSKKKSPKKKTPAKKTPGKKTPGKKTPGKKTPGKKKNAKNDEESSVEISGQPVFEEVCEALQNDLITEDNTQSEQDNINDPTEEEPTEPAASPEVPTSPGNIARGTMMPNIPIRGGPIRMSPARGSPRGGFRGGQQRFQRGGGVPFRGMPRGIIRPNMRPALPRSKKSLFELSQNKRKFGSLIANNGMSISPQTPSETTPVLNDIYRVNGLQVTSTPLSTLPAPITPSKLNGLHSIQVSSFSNSPLPVTPLKDGDIEAPAEVKEKKAYKKLISKIQAVHPDVSHEEAMRGIVALRTANNGTLTGMSMQEIITKVRENVKGEAETATLDSEVTNAAPVGEEFEKIVNALPASIFVTPSKVVDPATLYEIKCKFCSRLFKSSSETATKKVYEIHIQEHEKETRSLFEKEEETEVAVGTPDEPPANPDKVKSEISYCKLCQKQFKNAKLYGLHQNTEHAAESEFAKLMSSPLI